MPETTIQVDAARRFARRGAVTSPIRPFSLADMGIDTDSFLGRVAPTFHDLPLDPYDPARKAEDLVRKNAPIVYFRNETEWFGLWEQLGELQFTNALAAVEFWAAKLPDGPLRTEVEAIRPHRRRSRFQFLATPGEKPFSWYLADAGCPTYFQPVSDSRSRPRYFAPTPKGVRQDKEVRELICMACQLVTQTSGLVSRRFRVTLHQMMTFVDTDKGGEPAPEGHHQDGVDFIVSALVIERHNVVGGVSCISYDQRGDDVAFERELIPGEGILQSDLDPDLRLFHGVSPVYRENACEDGYRSILGLDIEFTG